MRVQPLITIQTLPIVIRSKLLTRHASLSHELPVAADQRLDRTERPRLAGVAPAAINPGRLIAKVPDLHQVGKLLALLVVAPLQLRAQDLDRGYEPADGF